VTVFCFRYNYDAAYRDYRALCLQKVTSLARYVIVRHSHGETRAVRQRREPLRVCRIYLRAMIVTDTAEHRTRLSCMISAISVYLLVQLIKSRYDYLLKKIFYAIYPFTVKLEAIRNKITKVTCNYCYSYFVVKVQVQESSYFYIKFDSSIIREYFAGLLHLEHIMRVFMRILYFFGRDSCFNKLFNWPSFVF